MKGQKIVDVRKHPDGFLDWFLRGFRWKRQLMVDVRSDLDWVFGRSVSVRGKLERLIGAIGLKM